MNRLMTLLHISDLHFVRELTTDVRGWHARAALLRHARRLARRATPKHWLGARPHSFGKLEALSAKIETLKLAEGRRIDLLLATGDLTTNGDEEALRTMLNYVANREVRVEGRLMTEGLGAADDMRLLLPGNHDRYDRDWIPFQTRSRDFERVLRTPPEYPYLVGFRPPDRPDQADEPALLFYVFDSTPSVAVSWWPFRSSARSWFTPWQFIARGRLEDVECRQLVRLSQEVISRGTVRGLDGKYMQVDFDRCIRVAVLHHHPLDEGGQTLVENNTMFIDYCFAAAIDLVLFGHDHKKFWQPLYGYGPAGVASVGNPHRIDFFCCPSASEFSAKNGFYIFDFYRDGTAGGFNHELYEWDAATRGFERAESQYVPFNRTL